MANKKFGLILAIALANSAVALGDPFILAFGSWLHNHFSIIFPDGYINTLHTQTYALVNILTAHYKSGDDTPTTLSLSELPRA